MCYYPVHQFKLFNNREIYSVLIQRGGGTGPVKPRQPYLLTIEVSEFSVPIPAEVVLLGDEVYGNVHKASSFGRGFFA